MARSRAHGCGPRRRPTFAGPVLSLQPCNSALDSRETLWSSRRRLGRRSAARPSGPDRLGAGVTRAVFRVRHRLRPPAVAGTAGAAAGWRGRWRSLRGPDFPQGSICKKRQAMMDVPEPCGTGQKSGINCARDVRLRQRGLFPGPPEWASCAPGSASAACLPGPGQRGDALSSATGVRVGWTRIRAGLGVRRTGLASADRATLPGRTRAAGPSGTSAFRCSVRAPGPDSAPRRL